jgi:LytS/YehU family sensor histidine kinase
MFERELHPLADELEMVRRYLAIMQARLGPRLGFHVDAPGDVPLAVPPGLLLTLAENAITHGIEPRLSGGRIDVHVTRLPGRIELGVQDSGDGLPPQWTEGVGLANTRRRLLGAFPDATLTLTNTHTQTDSGCLALLTLPSP